MQSDGNVGNYIQKWNGTSWSDVGGGMAGINNNPNDPAYISDMEVHNGNLYAGGIFEYAGNVPAQRIAVWDGNKWCGLGDSIDNGIGSMAFYQDTLHIGGGFWTINGDSVHYVAKWKTGGVDTCSTVGISEIADANNVFIFPNPSQGKFSIEAKGDLIIYSVLGEKIYSQKLVSEKTEIDLADKPNGIYFYQIISQEKIIATGKLVIQ